MMSFGFSKNRFYEDLFIDSSASRPVPMTGDSFAVASNRLFLISDITVFDIIKSQFNSGFMF